MDQTLVRVEWSEYQLYKPQMHSEAEKETTNIRPLVSVLVGMMFIVLTCPFNIFSETPSAPVPASAVTDSTGVVRQPVRPNRPVRPTRRSTSPIASFPDSIIVGQTPLDGPAEVVLDSVSFAGDSVSMVPIDSLAVVNTPLFATGDSEKKFTFNPDPTKAVWMSALFPGLGQLYNRRYWKLPIVVGAYMGLGYATNWNNTMLRDYTRAYSDIMDNDPTTKSYMDFFAPTVKEEDLDKSWLTDLLRRRKNYYRRNRDLCIICMIGVYAVAMIDAYVDAQLAHFDITPELSVDIAPTLLPGESSGRFSLPSVGFYWALNF